LFLKDVVIIESGWNLRSASFSLSSVVFWSISLLHKYFEYYGSNIIGAQCLPSFQCDIGPHCIFSCIWSLLTWIHRIFFMAMILHFITWIYNELCWWPCFISIMIMGMPTSRMIYTCLADVWLHVLIGSLVFNSFFTPSHDQNNCNMFFPSVWFKNT
jgi:hypothetical protein